MVRQSNTTEAREAVFRKYSVDDEVHGLHIPPSLALNALHKLGYQPSKTKLQKELQIRGPLTFARFEDVCAAQADNHVERVQLVEALRVFDKENRGRLEKSVVEEFLRRGDDGLNPKEVQYAMAFAQEDSLEETASSTTYINIESFATVLLEGRSHPAGGGAHIFGEESAPVSCEVAAAGDIDKGDHETEEANGDVHAAEAKGENEECVAEEAERDEAEKARLEEEKKQKDREEREKREVEDRKERSAAAAAPEKKEEKKDGGGCCIVM